MIKVLTHFTPNFQELADITVTEMGAYCQRHGYEGSAWLVEQYQVYNGTVKIQQILDELSKGDIGLLIDCDACITNHHIKIEDLIDDKHDFFISHDQNGVNAGVFIVRMTEWVRRFFENAKILIEQGKYDCEQNVIEDFLDRTNPLNNKVKILPQREINSYLFENYECGVRTKEDGQWVAGESFILHLPGMTINKRGDILNEIEKYIVR